MFLAIALLLTAFLLIIIVKQLAGVVYIRVLSIPVLCLLFVICLVSMSDTAAKSAVSGLNLWAGVVVPSLFPFLVTAEVMNSTGFIHASGSLLESFMKPVFNVPGCGSFAFIFGIISGYPVGAKITCDLRSRGLLTRTEAERLLTFTNNSGPLFIIGAIGTRIYGSPILGGFLFICHLLACITVGFIFRFYKAENKRSFNRRSGIKSTGLLKQFKKQLLDGGKNSAGFGIMLGDAVKHSVSTILTIGGYIVLFSVVIQFLTQSGVLGFMTGLASIVLKPFGIDKTIINGTLSGLLEITSGTALVSAGPGIPLPHKLAATGFITGWAGLSVHFQVMSISSKTDISIRPYFLGKLLQGILSAIYIMVGLKLLKLEALISEPVLGLSPFNPADFPNTLLSSICLLLAAFAAFSFSNLFKTAKSKVSRLL